MIVESDAKTSQEFRQEVYDRLDQKENDLLLSAKARTGSGRQKFIFAALEIRTMKFYFRGIQFKKPDDPAPADKPEEGPRE